MTTTRATVSRVRAVITDDGKSIAQISTDAGVHPTNARGAVRILSLEGQVFTCRRNTEGTKQHILMVFASEAMRDAMKAECNAATRAKQRLFRAAYKARIRRAQDPARLERQAAQLRAREQRQAEAEAAAAQRAAAAAERRALRAAEDELRKQRARLDREAKEAAKRREKAEAEKVKARLKAQTKAAGKLEFKKGTGVATPKKLAWADIPEHNPNGIKPIEVPSKLRDRFAVAEAPSVVSSRESRPWAEAVAS